jgi:hypothetical protein
MGLDWPDCCSVKDFYVILDQYHPTNFLLSSQNELDGDFGVILSLSFYFEEILQIVEADDVE